MITTKEEAKELCEKYNTVTACIVTANGNIYTGTVDPSDKSEQFALTAEDLKEVKTNLEAKKAARSKADADRQNLPDPKDPTSDPNDPQYISPNDPKHPNYRNPNQKTGIDPNTGYPFGATNPATGQPYPTKQPKPGK